MQNPHGQVVSVGTDSCDRTVVVAVESVVACERCASGKGCGAGLLGSQLGDKQIQATLAADLDVRIGDVVSIKLEPRHLLRAAVIVYGYPLCGAVLAAIAAFVTGLGEVAAALAALGGLVAGLLLARNRLRRSRCLRDFTPTVVGRLSAVGE